MTGLPASALPHTGWRSHHYRSLRRPELFLESLGSIEQSVNYGFSGFLPPLSENLAFALGRTIPIKFQLEDAVGQPTTSLGAITSLQIVSLDAAAVPVGIPLNPVPAGGTSLRNDGAQYVFNWQTKGLAAGSYQVRLTLGDGSQAKTKLVQLEHQGRIGSSDGLLCGPAGSGSNCWRPAWR